MKTSEREILETLVDKVRTLSVDQIRRAWWPSSRSGSRRADKSIRRLRSDRWIDVRRAVTRPIAASSAPLFRWLPGDHPPRFSSLARALHARAAGFGMTTRVCVATPRTRAFFGATLLRLKLTQVTHDLHVAEIFLRYRGAGRDLASRWVGEDNLPGSWNAIARPDALLLNADGIPVRAVEYGGDYAAPRLEAFHSALSEIDLAYE